MKIQFMGAAGTVTGSSYILTSGSGNSILIDLGMFQGPKEIENLNYQSFAYDCSQLQGAILTHAHLDHCGRLPLLLANGFSGDIWMTPPTRDLTELSLLDSAKIAKQDKKPFLYDKEGALQTIEKFKTVPYHESFQVGDFRVQFIDAGHIIGSASLEIEDLQSDSQYKKIIFSGDLGNTPEPLEHETEQPSSADVVIMESTYGDRLHPVGSASDTILSQIQQIEKSGGVLLIPAFSLERTQEILHLLMHLKHEGAIPSTFPIYVDSPMAEKATAIYLKYPDYLNSHIQQEIKETGPFEFEGLHTILKPEESMAIWDQPGAKVIIAGSGMMTGGRIMSHAAHYLALPTTQLLLVGYQGEGTVGRALLEGKKQIQITGIDVDVVSSVTTIQTMSSHADQGQLLSWLKAIGGVRKVILTHGEDIPRRALVEKISQELQITDIATPLLHDVISL